MDFDRTFSTNYLKVISFFLSDSLNFLKTKFSNVFVDVPNLKVDDLLSILETGAALILVFPTINQIIDFLNKTREYLIDVSIEEVIVRKYKVNPARIRPNDIMVAHTTYILSSRTKMVSAFNSEANL
jgi:tRNA (adenine57-N1/adenine58-N1)-methyltransferase